MFGLLFIAFVALLGIAGVGLYIYIKRRERRRRISAILADTNLLAQWTYSPDEWRRAVEEEFTWVKDKDSIGHVYASPTAIYVKNDFQDRLIELDGNGKRVTYTSYRGTEGSPLKLRVRWRVVKRYPDRPDEVKYYKEDYRVPVPLKHRADAGRIADFFTAKLEKNLDAYTQVVPDDDPISLFGKDSF